MKKTIYTLIFCLAVLAVNAQKKERVSNYSKDRRYDSTEYGVSDLNLKDTSLRMKFIGQPTSAIELMVAGGTKYSKIIIQDSAGKQMLRVTKNDTLELTNESSIKFIKIGNKVIPVEAFQKNEPVFLPLQYWQAVYDILLNSKESGLSAKDMLTLLNIIAQQLPQQNK